MLTPLQITGETRGRTLVGTKGSMEEPLRIGTTQLSVNSQGSLRLCVHAIGADLNIHFNQSTHKQPRGGGLIRHLVYTKANTGGC